MSTYTKFISLVRIARERANKSVNNKINGNGKSAGARWSKHFGYIQ